MVRNIGIGTGRRKTAVARVFVREGSGKVVVNGKSLKDYFATLKKGCTCPKDFPVCVCGNKPKAIVKSGGVKAGQKELENNKRSRSAKLRTALKL